MLRRILLLLAVVITSHAKMITHSDEIHPNYRVQLPQLGDLYRDPIWEEVLRKNFPQFDAVLHETEDGRTLVGFLDRFSPGKLIIWTYLQRPPQDDAFDGGGFDDDSVAAQLIYPLTPGGPTGQDPTGPEEPEKPGTDPAPVHTPEPATFALVGLALIAAASVRYRRG